MGTAGKLRYSVHAEVTTQPTGLAGFLDVPEDAKACVLFAHGSGSSRFSTRNRFVAEILHRDGLATLLLDLLTPAEGADRSKVFDIRLLARRLVEAADWLAERPETRDLSLGLFGASTGAATALVVAAEIPDRIGAVVSRGGRPDLAGDALAKVKAPTLLVVGGADRAVLKLNEASLARLTCEKRLIVVPGATHLFPEPGALERVAEHARDWFAEYLK